MHGVQRCKQIMSGKSVQVKQKSCWVMRACRRNAQTQRPGGGHGHGQLCTGEMRSYAYGTEAQRRMSKSRYRAVHFKSIERERAKSVCRAVRFKELVRTMAYIVHQLHAGRPAPQPRMRCSSGIAGLPGAHACGTPVGGACCGRGRMYGIKIPRQLHALGRRQCSPRCIWDAAAKPARGAQRSCWLCMHTQARHGCT